MLYRLHPQERLMWCDLSSSMVMKHLAEGADVSRLEWQPAERVVDDTFVALALREGLVCQDEIVVRGEALVNVNRAETLLATHREAQQAHERLRESDTYALLNELMPGNTEYNAELDQNIEAAVTRQVQEARAALAEDLSKPVQPGAAAFWERHGGVVPDL